MNRSTSFIPQRQSLVGPIGLIAWAVALVLVVSAAYVAYDGQRLRADRDRLAASLSARLSEANLQNSANPNTPTAADVDALSDQIAFFNNLTGVRPVSLVVTLGRLEALIPGDVWISQLFYNTNPATITMSLRSEQETNLPATLAKLEQAEILKSVILERQIRVQQGQRTFVQFDIKAELL